MAFLNNPAFTSFIVVLDARPGLLSTNVIPFQFMPDTITDNKSAVFNDINIIARSSPIKSYSHSSARQISFKLEFFAKPEKGQLVPTPGMIKKTVDTLRSLVSPTYLQFKILPPPKCLVIVGGQIAFVGICKSVGVSYSNNSPWEIRGVNLSHHATVSLTFEEALSVPIDASEVAFGLPISPTGFLGL